MTAMSRGEPSDDQPADGSLRDRVKAYLGLDGDRSVGRAFGKALRRGTAPEDPALHEPLRRLLAERRRMHERPTTKWFGRLAPILYALLAVMNLGEARAGGGWVDVLRVVAFAILAVLFPWSAWWERRRMDRLASALQSVEKVK